MGRRREPLREALRARASERSATLRYVLALTLVGAYAIACKTEPAQPAPEPTSSAAAAATAGKMEWKAAGPGDVAPLVMDAAAKAKAGGRKLVVYVGATWCEPCQKFHQAANKGELDKTLGDVSFLEFDADRDKERLEKAGYTSTYIPLFVIPDAQGKATARRVEGGIKGETVVAYLTRRIRAIIVGNPPPSIPGAATAQ